MFRLFITSLTTIFIILPTYSKEKKDPAFKMKFDEETKTMQPENVAVVVYQRGKAFIQKGEKKLKIKEGMPIPHKSLIQTQEDTFLKLRTADKSFIQLSPNSLFEFQLFHQNPDGSRVFVKKLIDGQMRELVTQKSTTESLKLRAGDIELAVTGTEYLVNVISAVSKPSEKKVQIGVLKGEVKVDINKLGLSKHKSLDVKAGEILDSEFIKTKQEPVLFNIGDNDLRFLKADHLTKQSDLLPFLNFEIPIKELMKKTYTTNDEVQIPSLKKKKKLVRKIPNWERVLTKRMKTPSKKKAITPQQIEQLRLEKLRIKEEAKKILPLCQYFSECLETKMENIGGRRIEYCVNEVTTKFPKDCEEVK